MKKTLFSIIFLAISGLVRAQTGTPPVRKTDAAVLRPQPMITHPAPIKTTGTSTAASTRTPTAVPLRTTDPGAPGRETLGATKTAANPLAAQNNRPALPSDSAVRQKKAPAN